MKKRSGKQQQRKKAFYFKLICDKVNTCISCHLSRSACSHLPSSKLPPKNYGYCGCLEFLEIFGFWDFEMLIQREFLMNHQG